MGTMFFFSNLSGLEFSSLVLFQQYIFIYLVFRKKKWFCSLPKGSCVVRLFNLIKST